MNATLLRKLNALRNELPPPLRRELDMVVHKITYPMKDILAKVEGDSLTQRAKRLKVSRQTMYVWISERFRPTLAQAKRISKYTDVPVQHILENGFENGGKPRRKARKKAAPVAAKRKRKAKRAELAASQRPGQQSVESQPDAA